MRRQLKHLKTESERDDGQDKRFFPESSIRRLFTRDNVKMLLECECSQCRSHRHRQQIANPAYYVSYVLASHSKDRHGDSGYVVLLALLVHIECPALIYTFIRGHCRDGQFKNETAKFTREYVQDMFQHKLPLKDAKEYAEEFHWQRYKFAIPRMKGDHYEEYPSSTILPFVNEKRLGRMGENGEIISEGHFGDVYSFNILEEYCEFPVGPQRPHMIPNANLTFPHQQLYGVKTFARKELRRNTPQQRFFDEKDNLLLVKKLQDKHLIQIVKSYRHGDMYNFIFPYAKTNLDLFLRDPSLQPFSDFHGAVREHPIWVQMLGIARGLHKVLDYEIPDANSENSLYGYHFDLKPANILVEWSGDLVITDFGQARFKKVDGTSSKVTGVGGNEAYAPPEIDEDLMVNNRRYDIWSLGCILLEVSAFVVKGHSGLGDLDKIRCREDTEARTRDDRFFRRAPASVLSQLTPGTEKSGTYELKPQIYQWVQHLPESVSDNLSREFINRILRVALKMLNVDVNSRLTSKEVCLRLSEIISDHQTYDSQPRNNAHVMPQLPSEGFAIGAQIMDKVQAISYNLEGFWNTARLHFVQESAFLCVQIFKDREWVRRPLGHWSQLRLIPQYALQDRGEHHNSDATISFTPNSLSGTSQRRYGKFSTSDILLLQEIVLAQKVHKDIKLSTAAAVLIQPRTWRKFIPRKSSCGTPSDAPMEVDANSVQLWTESLRQDIIGPDATARRQSPRSLRLGPGPVRVVIYYHKSVLILRVAKNERIEPRSNSDPSTTSITIVPADRATDPSFPVSILRPKPDESLAGFSLSKDQLEAQEEENSVECSSLKLVFVNKEGADSFQRTYKKLKKQWSARLGEFKNLQNHIGGQMGYFQST